MSTTKTGIEWTNVTWNPVRGCSRISPGCENCYAERQAARFSGPGLPYEGLVRLGKNGPRWTGDVRLVPATLDAPLRWKKPRRVFVNSMSDLFHERLTNEEIAAVFGVMAACPQHVFQVLTKRARRMREWFEWVGARHTGALFGAAAKCGVDVGPLNGITWPLPNVHLGVSCEDQQRADERIPELLATPAAVRWVSAEPLLGPVDLRMGDVVSLWDGSFESTSHALRVSDERRRKLDWIVVGGESGPGARPCAIEWIESVVEQCRDARMPVFCKQLGSHVVSTERVDAEGRWAWRLGLNHSKGGDPAEWPEHLRVRDWPAEVTR